jgi:cell division protein FtsB
MNYVRLAAGAIISAGMLIFLLSGTLAYLLDLFSQNPNDLSFEYVSNYLQGNIVRNSLFWLGIILIFAAYPILPKPAIFQAYNTLKYQLERGIYEGVNTKIKRLGLFILANKIITIFASVFLALFSTELTVGFYSIAAFLAQTQARFEFLNFLFEIFPLNFLLILVIILWTIKILMGNVAWLMDWFLFKEKSANYKVSSIVHTSLLYLSWIILIIIFYFLIGFNNYLGSINNFVLKPENKYIDELKNGLEGMFTLSYNIVYFLQYFVFLWIFIGVMFAVVYYYRPTK